MKPTTKHDFRKERQKRPRPTRPKRLNPIPGQYVIFPDASRALILRVGIGAQAKRVWFMLKKESGGVGIAHVGDFDAERDGWPIVEA